MYDMYQEIILQHYRSPRNFGKMEAPDLAAEESNPNCGDQITMELKLDAARTRVDEVRFHGEGCAISVASASMFTEKVKGRPLEELRAITQDDVLRMVGIPLSPVRLKCALTGFAAFGRAISQLRPPGPPASGWSTGGTAPA